MAINGITGMNDFLADFGVLRKTAALTSAAAQERKKGIDEVVEKRREKEEAAEANKSAVYNAAKASNDEATDGLYGFL